MRSKFDDNFERRYKCKIRESDQFTTSTYELSYNSYIDDFNSKYVQKKEHLYEITITQEGLSRLEYDLSCVEKYRLEATEYYAIMNNNRRRQREEEETRARNPAAAKAYQKYLLLLEMTADKNGTP